MELSMNHHIMIHNSLHLYLHFVCKSKFEISETNKLKI